MPPHPKPEKRPKKPGAMRPMSTKRTEAVAVRATKMPPKLKAAEKKALAADVAARVGTKTDLILGMLNRPEGATSPEMEAATGWASHSVRGLLGTLRVRGISVISHKEKGHPTVYRIERDPGVVL